MSSIEQSASRLRWAVLIGWGLLTLTYLAGRLGVVAGALRFDTKVEGQGVWLPFVVADISMIILTIAAYWLAQMLSAVSASHFFSTAAIRSFRSFALWLFLLALLWVSAPIVPELVRAATGGSGEYSFSIVVRDVLTVAITLILFLVARLLERARLIEEEIREIV